MRILSHFAWSVLIAGFLAVLFAQCRVKIAFPVSAAAPDRLDVIKVPLVARHDLPASWQMPPNF
ncbi:hypothetical protein [Rhizobium lentis]|uniref:hypothetical protein n=1 Tax=Rhizobium lentis TaxID=1138194 RepID=UPI001C82B8C4|nr:hypothetical protein [Rhizobium lentis]MBX5147242.1 hypothetical protein [Rhizobium lentis]